MSSPGPLAWEEWRAAWRRWLDWRYVWMRGSRNPGPKLLSVVVALTLWFVATGDRRANVEQGFDVPVSVRDTTGGTERRATSNLNPATVRVILAGRPERLRELNAGNIEAVVDVTGMPEGSFNQVIKVTPPTGTTVSRKTPERVQGFVDTQVVRTLPVTLSVSTPSETSLPRYTVSPAEASVSGPGLIIGNVRQVVTSPALLPAGAEREVALIALNGDGQPMSSVQLTPSTATVRRLDTGDLPVKTLRVVLNDPPKTLKATAVSIQPSTVRVVAAPELLSRLREVGGQVTYRVGTYTAPVSLSVPAGGQALETVSVRLTVTAATPAP